MKTFASKPNSLLGRSLLLACVGWAACAVDGPATTTNAVGAYQATGIKISEPTASTVTIWTRVTRDAERAADDRPLPILQLFDQATGEALEIRDNVMYPNSRPEVAFEAGSDLGSIRGAAIGAPGQTRVRYRLGGSTGWEGTAWRDVDAERDFTAVFPLSGLQPGSRYQVEVDARAGAVAEVGSTVTGGFVTAPAASSNAGVKFCVMTCQQYEDRDRPDGFSIYPAMLRTQPDFYVNNGDILYYDHGPVHALNRDLARYHWARMFSYATLREFHRQVGSFFMRDDHDTLTDDSHPGDHTGDFTFEEGLRMFRVQTAQARPPFRTVRWGRHLQIWMLEGRETRGTRAADRTGTPTVLGAEQTAWLARTLAESDATFRIVITPTPIVGPDRDNKKDNLANARYLEEGTRIRELLARQPNLTVITGDRHWQYVSRDPSTGLEEWSVGPASDAHAGGWAETTPRPAHRFLRTKHGGFLSGEIQPDGANPTLTLRLHDLQGGVVYDAIKRAVPRAPEKTQS